MDSQGMVSLADYRQKPNDRVVQRLEMLLQEAKEGNIQGFALACMSRDVDCRYWIVGNFDSWYAITGAVRVMGAELEQHCLQGSVAINPEDPPPAEDED